MTTLSDGRKTVANYFTQPVARLLVKTRISPNALTCLGFLISAAAAAVIGLGHPFAGGIIVLAGGLFDMLDGALARAANRATQFGAFLDSTLDRLAEGVVLVGILVLFANEPSIAGVVVAGLALVGSFMVSYTRARAEGLGLDCKVGVFTRAERVIVLALGLLLSQLNYALLIALSIITLFSFITTFQRLAHVWRNTDK